MRMDQRSENTEIRERCDRLLDCVFQRDREIQTFYAWDKDTCDEICSYMPLPQGAGQICLGDRWDSTDGYLYLLTKLTLPEARAGRKVFGKFDFSSIHEGYGHGFEAMLYIEGQPWHGVDENHKLVTLDAWSGKTIELELLLWAGITGKSPLQKTHIIRTAEVGWLDDELEDAATLLDMTLCAVQMLPHMDETRNEMFSLARSMTDGLRWNEGGDALRASALHGAELLKTGLRALPKPAKDCTMHCVGHTHIDYAWLWRVKHTREKIARSFSTVLRLFEEFPEYRFFQSSPEYYRILEQYYPALLDGARGAIRQGRWEPGGGMWVEADCNLISGESMIRQILYARRFFQSQFGKNDNAVWLPDTFGFGWAMPQILKKSGIDVFFTSKLSWNQSSRFPYDTFWWEGIDGSRVLASFLTVPANGFPPQPWSTTYNGEISPQTLRQAWELYQNKEISRDLLYLYGYGDGGGGSTRTMIKRLRALRELPLQMDIRFDTAGGFFETLIEQAMRSDTPVWNGELYLECHRGTYTSQAFAKRENRRLELRLCDSEFFQTLRWLQSGGAVPAEDLFEQWQILLRNQFHDILPGSSIHAVYDDLRREYAALHAALDKKDGAWFAERANSEGYTVWNVSGWARNALVELPANGKVRWLDEAGNKIESVPVSDGRYLLALRGIKPFSAACIVSQETEDESESIGELASVDLSHRTIETPLYVVQWANNGQLTRVYAKEQGFELFADGEAGNQLIAYEDEPEMFDAWDIDASYTEHYALVEDLISVVVVENNALRTIVRFTFSYGLSLLTQDMVFQRDDAAILFQHFVDWHEHQRLLRAEFPLNIASDVAIFDIPFGNMARPTAHRTAFDQARFEVPAHQWVDLSEPGKGVSLLNDCKYGHSAKGNRLGLSLIKSAIDPDEAADQGEHRYTYALLPHGGDWGAAGTHQRAAELNHPTVIAQGIPAIPPKPLFLISDALLEADAVKCSQSGNFVLLRLHEYGGKSREATVESSFVILRFCECDLTETPVGEWIEGNRIHFTISPFEIKTFLVQIIE